MICTAIEFLFWCWLIGFVICLMTRGTPPKPGPYHEPTGAIINTAARCASCASCAAREHTGAKPMSVWEQHVRDTRARTMGQLAAVYTNQVGVYNNHMSLEQIDCAGCGRWAEPSRAEPAYCHECGERVTAEAALAAGAADMTSTDIAAITDYIEQLKAAAIAKGGHIESFTEPPTDPPTTEPPPMSKPKHRKHIITAPVSGATPATYKGKSKSRKQPKPKDEVMPGRPMGERGQGRKPIAPELRQQVFTVRLSIERRDKIAALGKEWLERAIDRAKLAEA